GMGSWAWVGAGAWRSAGGSDTSRRVGRGGTMVAARPSGRGAHRRVAPHHRPAVPLAEHPELGELRLVQAVVPIGQVEHGVVEPLLLVLGSGFQDAASQDVGEQLVAGLLEQGGGGHSTGFRTLLGHARRAPVSSGSGGVGARRRGRPAADDLAPQCNKRRESAQRADHGRPGGYYHQRGAGGVSGGRRGGEREPEAGAHVRKVGAWATHQTKSTVRSGRSDCWRCCAAWRSGFRRSTGRGSCSSGCPSCRSCSETRAASCFTMKYDSRTI